MYTGRGCHASLGQELERLGVARALLLTGRSLAAGGLVESVRAAAAGRIAAEFGAVAQHNPTSSVEAAARAYQDAQADGIVAFGGGSVVDSAKAVAFSLGASPPIVDLATGLSGAEFACSFGQTDDVTHVKGGYRDLALTAKAVFLDPRLTEETPAWLWAATGMRAVDHAVESILADNAHPYVDALAAESLRILHRALPASLKDDSPALRMDCLVAAWMAHAGSYHVQWGLSHQMGRQVGARFDIPHGYTSAIFLPVVVELSGREKVEAEARVAAALGVHAGGAAVALRSLVERLHLPDTLSAAGVPSREAVEEMFAGQPGALQVVERSWE